MRVLYIEGVATHDGPGSCAGVREGVGEALAGVRVGGAIEPRNFITSGGRRRGYVRKATTGVLLTRGTQESREVEDP